MKNIALLFLTTLLLFSCGGERIPRNQKLIVVPEPYDSTKVEEVIEEEVIDLGDKITNINAEEKLRAFGAENLETKIKITTEYGVIKIRLFEDCPLHRASFVLLTKRGFFNNSLFYRIQKGHVVQGGMSDSDESKAKFWEIGSYKVPSEVGAGHPHVRGAVALAGDNSHQGITRDDRSSPFNFYIVDGGVYNTKSLDFIEVEYDKKISAKSRKLYSTKGGLPHLDGDYTVFGEVYSGMSVVKKISQVEVDGVWPKERIVMQVEVIE